MRSPGNNQLSVLGNHNFEKRMKRKKFEVFRKSHYVLVDFKGNINVEDIIDALNEGIAATHPEVSMPAIWDLTNSDLSDFDPQVLHQIANVVVSVKENLPIDYVALVSEKKLNIGLMKFFKAVYTKDIIKIFDTHQEAEDWILEKK